jgi:hypothetical protein
MVRGDRTSALVSEEGLLAGAAGARGTPRAGAGQASAQAPAAGEQLADLPVSLPGGGTRASCVQDSGTATLRSNPS